MTYIGINVFGQKINAVISNDMQYDVYVGITNPISVFVDNCSCDSLILTTDNGRLRKFDDCRYFYNPIRIGDGKVILKVKKGKDTTQICSYLYKVKILPLGLRIVFQDMSSPLFEFDSTYSYPIIDVLESTIDKATIKNASYLHPYWKNDISLHGAEVEVIDYNIIVMREGKIISNTYSKNPFFKEAEKKIFNNLESGDILIFSNINYIFPGGEPKFFQPIEYRIK